MMQLPKGYVIIREEELLKMQQQMIAMHQTIEDLQKKINKNSSNSHKPPSSDAFRKPIQNNREKSNKKPGAQPGHKGTTLTMVDNPDRIILHKVTGPCTCGRNLKRLPVVNVQRRQVHDLAVKLTEITEHRNEVKLCVCGQLHYGESAHITTVKYGPRIKALSVYLNNVQFIPYNRLQDIFHDCFDINISDGALQDANEACFINLEYTEKQIKANLKAGPVLHNDETGMRCDNSRKWVLSSSNKDFTHYAIHARRGSEALNDIGILPGYRGTSVHDRYTSYDTYPGCRHSHCNAHLLRDLKSIVEDGKAWASSMITLLLKAKNLIETTQPTRKLRGAIFSEYDEIIMTGLAAEPPLLENPVKKRGRKKKTPSLNLLETFSTRKQQILEFFVNPLVPFDNNLAERDLRMIKLKEKISGCFRTKKGADIFCRIRSYISTLRKQGYNLLDSLQMAIDGTPVSFYLVRAEL
jgi:transposase